MSTISSDSLSYIREPLSTTPVARAEEQAVKASTDEAQPQPQLEQLSSLLSVVKNSEQSESFAQEVSKIKQEIEVLQFQVDMEALVDNIAEHFIAEGVV